MQWPSSSRDIQWPNGTIVHYPGSEEFAAATLRWSIYKAPKFSAAITPLNEEAIADIVKVARAANIPFLATGGRHGYGTTLGNLQGGLAIDLSQLKAIEVDKAAGTVTVGAGVRIGDAMRPVYDAGYELPVGSCPHVGLIGATLGGGVGVLQGLFGLIIDSLLSVRLITANGNLVEASISLNPDLFWAIRGAGFNFGIITSATYKLNKAVNNGKIMTADMIYPANMKSAYFKALQAFENKMPQELAIISTIRWDSVAGETQIIGTFVYSGTEHQGRQILAPFFELDPPTVRVSVVPYIELFPTILFGWIPAVSTPGGIHDIYSANVRKFELNTLNSACDKFDAFYRAYPDGRSSVGVLETFSTHAVGSVSADVTAYPWRNAKGNFMFQMSWSEPGSSVEEAANILARGLRRDFTKTSGFDDLSVYVSYAHGDETVEQIYSKEKLPRLVSLKREWDPDNVFRYNNSLPLEYP
ncbi:FAD-binding domain-containing protein [Daldinia decipiens]|uniref:FAD-binding domain-containing protein n=1 Tax=Daldinia decipiens TaxID=326647 RepID=UPI0020C21F0A|nr:FAD-binding domain-containing protein [Daldinia decipiens]KAI1658575.1 FAD-binding domain-containing protein [Daldinia decipiens]